LTREIDPLIIL